MTGGLRPTVGRLVELEEPVEREPITRPEPFSDPEPIGWRRHRTKLAWAPAVLFTTGWVVFVLMNGHFGRVTDHWRTAVTMVFGSFVAGSTPQGGGAVAFPVFTKVLEIPAAVARSFSLSIQATGMVVASLSILIAGRRIDKKAVGLGILGGGVGFLVGLTLLIDRATPFWNSRVADPYVKVTFTVAIASLAMIVFLCFREGSHGSDGVGQWTPRGTTLFLVLALMGGLFTSLAGSGVDVFLFVFVVLIAGVHPRVGVPSSIISMAFVSTMGLVILGLIDGQLSIDIDAAGDVIRAGDTTFAEPQPGTQFDLFGIWLSAAPIVVWGAPFGAWVASVVSPRTLITFVGAMAVLEVSTTILFLEALRTDMVLVVYFAVGVVVALWLVRAAGRNRDWLVGQS